MFDLEESIADWRKQMLAAGIKTPVPLEELEIHLREDIEQQMKSGTDPQQAFEKSVQRIGHADELKSEFKKTCGMECYPKLTKWILQMDQWSLLLWGVTGLVMTWILSLVTAFVSPRSAPVFFVDHWVRAWLPNYVTFTTFTISGLVIGFARWHTKWTLLWISSIGLIGTMIVNLVCRFVFHRSDSVFFSSDWMVHWLFGFYANWTIFIVMGLLHGLSNYTLWLTKLVKTTRD
jgi:hypothetical protein